MAQHPDNAEDIRSLREAYPSGLMALLRNESIAYILDALMDSPPHHEFNQSELAREAGVSRQTVRRHLDLLLELGILEAVEHSQQTRYRFDAESAVSEALIVLEGAVNAAVEE